MILCWEGGHECLCWFFCHIVSPSPSGPTLPSDLSLYVIVELPNLLIPKENKLFTDKPWTWVTFPIGNFQCEKHYFTNKTMSIWVCKAIDIHKLWGVKPGPGKYCGKVYIYIPRKHIRYQPIIYINSIKLSYWIILTSLCALPNTRTKIHTAHICALCLSYCEEVFRLLPQHVLVAV